MKLLAIDTSTKTMSVAVLSAGVVLAERSTNAHREHSVKIMPAISGVLQDAHLSVQDLDAIAVTVGPGSYTGVRIGVTIAKTLAWSLNVPLYSVSTLQTLAMNAFCTTDLLVPMIDARRERVYAAVFRRDGNKLVTVVPERVIHIEELIVQLRLNAATLKSPALLLGEDISIYKDRIQRELAGVAQFGLGHENIPRASVVGYLAQLQPEESALHLTPNYLQVTEAESRLKRLDTV